MRNNYRFKQQVLDQGRLQINVFATDVGKPASDANVVITSKVNNQVVEELVTDSSGQTAIIDLASPPVDFSLEPETEIKPYSEYDLSVNMEGYEPLQLDGVQILSNTTALQNIDLRPIVRDDVETQNIIIEPHTLWGIFPPKIPEDEVKPLPESVGFVVLPEPVIPEFIVVHEGVPTDASARNLWIPFKDYIKNVASSEIYSTWPAQSIRANVLAILSFTLNRVYTEWYRGKGFDFTITNSTAYDQSFVYGRNVFQEIASVVDDLFTTFVTRPEIRQPLFTQYCDGSRVRCPNMMEQWGTKTLADQGYDAIGILKYYYGQDVFLMQANKVSGVPMSYPGTALQMGSTGPNVRTIQEQLNAISNNYPAINKIRVDGVFGEQTRTAVETFQKVFHLPSTGIVDFATWYQISNIFVAVTKMAELA